MTNEEIVAYFNDAVLKSGKDLAYLQTVPLWEIAYQLAVGNEQRERTRAAKNDIRTLLEKATRTAEQLLADAQVTPYDFAEDAQNLANNLAANLPGKGDAGGQRGGFTGRASWASDQETARVWRENAGYLQDELNQARESLRLAVQLKLKAQEELAAANQHVKILQSDRPLAIAACLRSCAESIRYNHLDFASAEKYLLDYAATVERESTKTRPPSPGVGVTGSNGPTW